MHIRILGSAAGGGFPQWNCNCRNCDGLRSGRLQTPPRTQSSIAISANAVDWLLCNASPDILRQIQQTPALQPARALRDTAIAAILLIDAQIDHTTGLYMLREHRQPLPIWLTDAVREDLSRGNPLLPLLDHYCGTQLHRVVPGGGAFAIPALDGLRLQALDIVSNAPPYSPHRDSPEIGDNIALLVEDIHSGRRLFYAPGLGRIDAAVWDAMQSADVVLVDGTCWSDDELITLGVSRKRARDMGHLPQAGTDGMLEWLSRLPATTRKILIHINNTNPILDSSSAEYAALRAAGVELSYDGMDIEL